MTPKQKTIYLLSVLGLIAVILLPACRPQKQDESIFIFDKQKFKLPKYDSLEYFNISADGNRFLALYKTKDKWYAQVNKTVFDDFQGTFLDSFTNKPKYSLSSEGSKLGLVYQKEKSFIFRIADEDNGNSNISPVDTLPMWFVQINQYIYGGFDGDYMPEIKYTSNGLVFGFVYKKSGLYYIRLNEEVFGPYQKADLSITYDGRITIARIDRGYAYLEEIEIIPNPKSR